MVESSYNNLSSIQSHKYYCHSVMVVTGTTKSLSFPNALRSARPLYWNLESLFTAWNMEGYLVCCWGELEIFTAVTADSQLLAFSVMILFC